MVFGDKGTDVSLNIRGVNIKESKEEKLVGVIVDKKLCFKQQASAVYLQKGWPKATCSLENLSIASYRETKANYEYNF